MVCLIISMVSLESPTRSSEVNHWQFAYLIMIGAASLIGYHNSYAYALGLGECRFRVEASKAL